MDGALSERCGVGFVFSSAWILILSLVYGVLWWWIGLAGIG